MQSSDFKQQKLGAVIEVEQPLPETQKGLPDRATARPDADPCTGLRLRLGLWQINFTHICTLTCTYMCTRVSLGVCACVCLCAVNNFSLQGRRRHRLGWLYWKETKTSARTLWKWILQWILRPCYPAAPVPPYLGYCGHSLGESIWKCHVMYA